MTANPINQTNFNNGEETQRIDQQDEMSIHVGSRAIQQSSNELTLFAEGKITKNDSKKKEIAVTPGQKKHGFRNLKDMFAAVRDEEEMEDKEDSCSEPGSDGEASPESSCDEES